MADGVNSAAALAASAPIKVETISIPGFGAGQMEEGFDPSKYRVRYGKYDFDDLEGMADLEQIETRGLLGTEIVVLNKNTYTFMDKYIMVVCYLEKINEVA